MYRVLRPEFEQTGERLPDGRPVWRVREWVELGTASSMEEAKQFHRAPILEAIQPRTYH